MDQAVKTALELAAREYKTSVSQMTNFLLAESLIAYFQGDTTLLAHLDDCLVQARAIHHELDIDLQQNLRPDGAGPDDERSEKSLLKRLTEIAKPQTMGP